MEKSKEQEIQDLFQTHENNFCFECGGHSNQWVSVNNGIFLCVLCAGIHRGFGMDISCVRSLTMDSLSQAELNMMKKGGNDHLKEFFERYNILMEGHMDAKYRTKAAYHYREKLKALAEDQPLPTSPRVEEGLELVEQSKPDHEVQEENARKGAYTEGVSEENDDASADNKEPSDKKNGAKIALAFQNGFKSLGNSITKGAKTVATGTKNATIKLNEKVKNSNLKENTKVFGNKVAVGVKGAAGKVAVVSKEIIHTGGVYAGKGADAAKKGYVGAVGYFKSISMKKKEKGSKHEIIGDENVDVANHQEQIISHEEQHSFAEDPRPSVSL